MAKIKNNTDLVKDLMNFSPYGALGQIFIIQALEFYCNAVIAEPIKEDQKNGLINPVAWKGTAEDIKKRMADFYAEQNQPKKR